MTGAPVSDGGRAAARPATLGAGVDEHGPAKPGCAQARWPSSIGWTVAPAIASASASCSSGRHRAISGRAHDRGRHVDLIDPAARVVRADRVAGLDDRCASRGGASRRRSRPAAAAAAAPRPGARARARSASRRAPAATAREHRRLVREARAPVRDEPGRGRAEHQAGHEIAVAPPEQLRDRAAHRVTDGDRRGRSPSSTSVAAQSSAQSARRKTRRRAEPWPWPRRSGAMTRKCSPSGSNAWNQFRPPVATQPWSSRTRRRARRTRRPRGRTSCPGGAARRGGRARSCGSGASPVAARSQRRRL